MPNPRGAAGDLYAEIKVMVPPKPTARERELFEQLAAGVHVRPQEGTMTASRYVLARRPGIAARRLCKTLRICIPTWCADWSRSACRAGRMPRGELWFEPSALVTVGRIQRLRTGLGLNYAAIGLVLDLLDHIEELESALVARTEDITVDINRLTQKSQEALDEAQSIATRLGHTEVDGEHLLMALLDQPEGLVPRLLDQAGADPRPCARTWSAS